MQFYAKYAVLHHTLSIYLKANFLLASFFMQFFLLLTTIMAYYTLSSFKFRQKNPQMGCQQTVFEYPHEMRLLVLMYYVNVIKRTRHYLKIFIVFLWILYKSFIVIFNSMFSQSSSSESVSKTTEFRWILVCLLGVKKNKLDDLALFSFSACQVSYCLHAIYIYFTFRAHSN